MNLYVWDDVLPVSDGYHDSGGLGVIAANVVVAREIADHHMSTLNLDRWSDAPERGTWYDKYPNHIIRDIPGSQAAGVLFVHPNAGCC